MKLATVKYNGQTGLLIAKNGQGYFFPEYSSLEVIRDPALKNRLESDFEKGKQVVLSELEFLAPIPTPPRDIICVGKNYAEHAMEFKVSTDLNGIPEDPIFFTKSHNALLGHQGEIVLPSTNISQQVDYEAELAVIIGRQARNVKASEAMDYVWGYSIINDISARDLQVKHKQWFLGKALDTFCPMGPYIVSADEIDGQNINITCHINGELRQNGNTKDMLFSIPSLIETLTSVMTLEPACIISTGSLGGVGAGFNPPKFLKAGDITEVAIQGIGSLCNKVVVS